MQGVTLSAGLESFLIYLGAALFAALLGALIIAGGRFLLRLSHNSTVIHEFVVGRPEVTSSDGEVIRPGIPSAHARFEEMTDHFTAIDEHLTDQDAKIDRVEHEVQENSGSSLKDAVKGVRSDVSDLRADVGRVEGKLDQHMTDAKRAVRKAPAKAVRVAKKAS